MAQHETTERTARELDVRPLRKPDKHPTIFGAFRDLPVNGALLLVNDHDPRHLREEFAAEYPDGFGWEYLTREPRNWRIRITKLAAAPLPRVLVDTADVAASTGEADVTGAVWRLDVRERDLDSNIIALPPAGSIDRHVGPGIDVLIHALAGTGELITERGSVPLRPGALVWLPRGSVRQFTAGPEGLRYLTVHQRRQALVLDPTQR